MGPKINEVETDNAVPLNADVVVIGAGVIGLMSAYFLAARRLSVVVVEKGHIACEQSSRNWGWCRQSMRDPREFDLIREALRLWPTLNERFQGDTGFRPSGIVFAARTERDEEDYRRWIAEAAQADIHCELLRGAELQSLLVGDAAPPRAGLYCASDGRAEPQWTAPAVASAARRLGAKVVCRCAARGFETSAGRLSSVVTERGTIATKTVIIAGGAWTRRLLKDLGVHLPQLKVRSSVARTTPLDGGPECALWDGRIAYRKRADGGYTIADGSTHVVPLTPDSFRFLGDFTSMLRREWRHLRLRLNDRFFTEWSEAQAVPLDRPSPYPGAGSRARRALPARRARRAQAALSEVRQPVAGADLGGFHRRHARCASGDCGTRTGSGRAGRDRLFRPRLRHFTGGRSPCRRHGHGRQTTRRSAPFPTDAIF